MIGQPLQGFGSVDGDYRHAKLMSYAAQNLVERSSRGRRIHAVLKSRRRHNRTEG